MAISGNTSWSLPLIMNSENERLVWRILHNTVSISGDHKMANKSRQCDKPKANSQWPWMEWRIEKRVKEA